MIYIYDDQYHNIIHLMRAVKAVVDMNVDFCTAKMIEDGCLDKANLIIVPGGADSFFCEKLNGNGNKILRNFINDGGSYLGICAGAYYGCSTLNWNNGEIDGSRELAFYKGCAIGPVAEWVENVNSIYDGSWKAAVNIKLYDGSCSKMLYDGGPVFTEPKNNEEVLARYEDLKGAPPAIIEGAYGKGAYILSSPHIEKFGHLLTDGLYKLFNSSHERELEVANALLVHEEEQKEFFKTILNRLL